MQAFFGVHYAIFDENSSKSLKNHEKLLPGAVCVRQNRFKRCMTMSWSLLESLRLAQHFTNKQNGRAMR